jgi:UDP-hydrolysing UDP-N-acetyl-D-glucosamine 2-epimerase
VSTDDYARRVAQLGEEPWRISVTGAPSLDNLRAITPMSPEELQATFGISVDPAPLLVTFHPVTLEYEQAEWQARELMTALDAASLPVVFTQPNADQGGRFIATLIDEFVDRHPSARQVANLGLRGYFGMMDRAAAMLGNSSSGLIEAPSFALPVVNVGNRQGGRVRGANVIDVGHSSAEILDGIRRATTPGFRRALRGVTNPYGDGHAAGRIVERLRTIGLDADLRVKRFRDLDSGTER